MQYSKTKLYAMLTSKKHINGDAISFEKSKNNRNETIPEINDESLIPAAVLVLLFNHPDGLTVLFTKRADNMTRHAGQISLPGGRIEANDPSPKYTALRETEEEIGLRREEIEIVCQLDEYAVGTGFLITPFVGFADPPLKLTPQYEEVAEIFEAPLSYLINPNNYTWNKKTLKGESRRFLSLQWNNYYIWGATAGILHDLSIKIGHVS